MTLHRFINWSVSVCLSVCQSVPYVWHLIRCHGGNTPTMEHVLLIKCGIWTVLSSHNMCEDGMLKYYKKKTWWPGTTSRFHQSQHVWPHNRSITLGHWHHPHYILLGGNVFETLPHASAIIRSGNVQGSPIAAPAAAHIGEYLNMFKSYAHSIVYFRFE